AGTTTIEPYTLGGRRSLTTTWRSSSCPVRSSPSTPLEEPTGFDRPLLELACCTSFLGDPGLDPRRRFRCPELPTICDMQTTCRMDACPVDVQNAANCYERVAKNSPRSKLCSALEPNLLHEADRHHVSASRYMSLIGQYPPEGCRRHQRRRSKGPRPTLASFA